MNLFASTRNASSTQQNQKKARLNDLELTDLEFQKMFAKKSIFLETLKYLRVTSTSKWIGQICLKNTTRSNLFFNFKKVFALIEMATDEERCS